MYGRHYLAIEHRDLNDTGVLDDPSMGYKEVTRLENFQEVKDFLVRVAAREGYDLSTSEGIEQLKRMVIIKYVKMSLGVQNFL